MAVNLRRQGIYGDNLPTKKNKTVEPSDFLIGGIIGRFERQYKKAFLCDSFEDFQNIFGQNTVSTYYGYDAVTGFFQNIVGTSGKAYISSHVGYTGSAYDGVTATASPGSQESSPNPTIQIDDGYEDELCFGSAGNRTGYTITNGFRFTTAANGAGTASDTFAILDSVSGIKVGDIVRFDLTGGSTVTVYKKIVTIDESLNKVTFSSAIHATANLADNDVVRVIGFQLKTYKKDINGVVKEVDTQLGKIWCTMEAEVSDFYVENVFSSSPNIIVTDLALTASAIQEAFPADVSTITYLASGADGTTPTTAAHWAVDLLYFDNLPIRMLTNAETSTSTIQQAGETYCKGRWDNPKWIYMLPENQTKSQLQTLGQNFQRSDDVLGVIIANWLKVVDPFSTSSIAPYRNVPCVGFVMGAWIRSIGTKGVHWIPAVQDIPLFGVQGIVGDTFEDDEDRTDILESGVNLIQYRKGIGYVMRNFSTPSTTKEFFYANGILMRDYIKISVVDSLSDTENEPNSFNRIQSSKNAVLNFLYQLWNYGSTGNSPKGETFGQTFKTDGTPTNPEDHFEVIADLTNNPQSKIELGERNIDVYFSYPSPAGSIKIGVGILLLG